MSSQEKLPPEGKDQQEDDRRYLIATGTAQYEHLPGDLPSVEEDLRRIHRLLCEEGTYQRSIEDLGEDLALNPDSGELRAALDEWFSAEDRTPDDVAVVYYTGHGGVEGESGTERHYLLTSDSQPNLFTTTAFPAEEIARYIGKSSLRRVLLLLDTCFAGYGSGDITKNLSNLRHFFSEEHVHVSIIAASWPKGEAYEGAFTEALSSVLDDPRWAGDRQRYVPLDSIRAGINQHFEKKGLSQTAVHHGIATGSEHPPFFRNPRHKSHLPEGIDLREQRRIRSMDPAEARLHWGPRGRGVEIDTKPGWYFTGRKAILEELVEWLERPAEKAGARVITGPPGIGKSSVLARLVTLADPEFRDRAPLEDFDSSVIPPVGSIDVAVHAKKKTLPDIAQSISRAMGKQTTDPDSLVQLLEKEEDSFTIILDALDEANDPEIVAHDLLRRLTPLSSVRLLVGTREGPIQDLGSRVEVKDLDDPEYRSRSDLVSYAKRRLLARDEPTVETPYRDRPDLADRVASIIAEKADPIFLIARLICEDLVDAEEVVDPDDSEWREQLPESVSGAFEGYLSRFGSDEFKIRDLLRPIAYAQGAGLPWENLWAPLASALSPHDRSYTDEDVAWALDEASSYLVEDLLEERSVYRLYHQAFVDFFHHEERDRERHRRIAEALAASVPDLEKEGGKDWRQAHPYVRRHLSTHAAAGGVLSEFVGDPLYLVTGDPLQLAAAIDQSQEEHPGYVAQTYQLSVHNLQAKSIEERASYLELTAKKQGASSLADKISSLPIEKSWEPLWVNWRPISQHRVFEDHKAPVKDVAAGQIECRTVVASGSNEGTVLLWAVDDGECINQIEAHTGSVNAVVMTAVRGDSVVVSGGADRSIRVWPTVASECLLEIEEAHTGTVSALATGVVDDQIVIVSGGTDQIIRVWSAKNGKLLCSCEGHSDKIRSVAMGNLRTGPVIVSGGADETVRVWAADTGELIEIIGEKLGLVNEVAVGTVNESAMAVSCSRFDFETGNKTLRAWALETGKSLDDIEKSDASVDAVAMGTVGEREFIVSARVKRISRGEIEVRDAASGNLLHSFEGHNNEVNAVDIAAVKESPTVVSGGEDSTIRLWEVGSHTRLHLSENPIGSVKALSEGVIDDDAVVAYSTGRQIVIQDVWTGKPIRSFGPSLHQIGTLAMGNVDGNPVIVSGGSDRTMRLWDARSGRPLHLFSQDVVTHPDAVNSVAMGIAGGRSIIVSSNDGLISTSTLQIWEAETGESILTLKGHPVSVNDVAIGTTKTGRTVVVAGGLERLSRGSLRIWAVDSGNLLHVLDTNMDEVKNIATGIIGDTLVVASGYEYNVVRTWDAKNGKNIYDLKGHKGEVEALSVGYIKERPFIVSSSEGNIKLWGLEPKEEIFSLSIGASINNISICNETIVVASTCGVIAIYINNL